MAEEVGRDVSVTWGGVAIEGLREKGLTCNGEPIDVTNDDDNGYRRLMTATKRDEVNVSLSGVTRNKTLKNDWMAGGANRQKAVVITWPDGAVLSMTANLVNWNETLPYEDAITFSVELRSSGAWVYTPGV